jgi:adenylate cyclase class IV
LYQGSVGFFGSAILRKKTGMKKYIFMVLLCFPIIEDVKAMIEVEVRFHLTEEKRDLFFKDAVFISEKTFTDTYYDADDYSLSIQDIWLRARDGKFVLKTPATRTDAFSFDKISPMYENEDEDEIRRALSIQKSGSLAQDVQKRGYKPLYTFTTTRKKYKKNGFSIDLDHVDYKTFSYDICEVEIIVETNDEIQDALQKIRSFIESHRITIQPIDGKLIYLIKQVNPEHFQALEKANASTKCVLGQAGVSCEAL